MDSYKLTSKEIQLVKERSRNRIKERFYYSIFGIFLIFIGPVFPFKRGGAKVFPKNWIEYLESLPFYGILVSIVLIIYWIENIFLKDLIFKKKQIITGHIENWIQRKHNYGDVTYELIIKTNQNRTMNLLTFEKHLKHFKVGEKYQFHISKYSKVLVNIARIRYRNKE